MKPRNAPLGRKYVRLFEEFSNQPDYTDVLELLYEGDYGSAKLLLNRLANLNQTNRMIYDDYFSPPERLERRSGISGISKSWKMPFRFNEKELQFLHRLAFTFSEDGYTKDKVWIQEMILDALIELNPELGGVHDIIRRGRRHAMSHIINGCVSKFNLDDMEFFITQIPEGESNPDGSYSYFVNGSRDKGYEEIHDEAERLYGGHIEWFASPRTLRSIIRKLDEKRLYRQTDHIEENP